MKQKPYHYTESGLKNLYLDALVSHDDNGEEIVTIRAINKLHKLIAKVLLTLERKLRGDELRFIRTEMGLKQADLAKLLHCKPLTIGRWERGEVVIDVSAEAVFRKLACEQLHIDISMEKLNEYSGLKRPVKPIHIDASRAPNYRLAA